MYGTLARALAARKVEFETAGYSADVLGTIRGERKETIRITNIHVVFHIPGVSEEQRAAAERAVQFHAAGCPAHESVKGAIEITWEADWATGGAAGGAAAPAS